MGVLGVCDGGYLIAPRMAAIVLNPANLAFRWDGRREWVFRKTWLGHRWCLSVTAGYPRWRRLGWLLRGVPCVDPAKP